MSLLWIYCSGTMLLAIWLGYNMYRHLDHFDWAYRSQSIWFDFWATLILWPFLVFLNPRKLLFPSRRTSSLELNADYIDVQRRRAKFLENPPPCAETVCYQPSNADGDGLRAEFYFPADAVGRLAREISFESPGMVGMQGAVRWVSARDSSLVEPSVVPEILVNFDYIADRLISEGIGQVRCHHCQKDYSTQELSMETEMKGNWVYANFMCPLKHSLMYREVMHFYRKRNDS